MADTDQYALDHLLEHLRRSGLTFQQIEEVVCLFPRETETYLHFAGQLVEMLPEEERAAARIRLLKNTVKITVLTAPGQPFFYLPDIYRSSEIDAIVRNRFGSQPNRAHNWRGD